MQDLTLNSLKANELFYRNQILKLDEQKAELNRKLSEILGEIYSIEMNEIRPEDILITILSSGVEIRFIPTGLTVRVYGRSSFACKHHAMEKLKDYIMLGRTGIVYGEI